MRVQNLNMDNLPTNFVGEAVNSAMPSVIDGDDNSKTEMTQEQVLTFVDDKQLETFVLPLEENLLTNVSNQGLELREHTVRDFLSRPMNIGQFTWSSSQVRNAEIFSISFPSLLFNQGMIAEKISGFNYLRGNIHVRLQINAQNFQAGIFQLRYFPVLSPSDLYNSQLNTMKQFSGLPGIDVNLQSDKPMQIVVPFVYPNDVYDIVAEPDDWAQVHARVYSPLTAASSTSVSITVWAWFDKPSLVLSMPCSASSLTVAKVMVKHYEEQIRMRTAQLQIGGEQKTASQAGGPISNLANAVSTVATVASGIPGLGAIAGTVATVSNIVGSISSMFGFSKPTSNQTVTQVRPIFVRGMANSDSPDSVTQTALITDNNLIEGKPVFGTDVDEMSFDFIARIPQFIGAFDYATTNVEGQLIYFLEINPAIMTSDQTTDSTITTTSLGLLCSCFELWRGSLNLTFKFAKTQFHSGRIIFVWFNSDSPAMPGTYTSDLAKNPAIQFDLHEKFEIDINIPYIQSTPWLNIHSIDSQLKRANGWLGVYVVNTLQAAPSASSIVECVVEARAGSDFELAIPKPPELLGSWVNPSASDVAPVYSYMVFVLFTFNPLSSAFTLNTEMPWDSSILGLNDGSPTGTTTSIPAGWRLLFEGTEYDVGGGTLTLAAAKQLDNRMRILMTSSVDSTLKYDETLSINPSAIPINWLLLEPPTLRMRTAELQISRDESFQGIDGVSILPSVNPQTVTDVNKDTVGEVVKSLRVLLKRYAPEFNFSNGLQFGRTFVVVNPDVFSSIGLPSASYMSLFAPAYRFWRGSRRYKAYLEYTGDANTYNRVFPYYFLPNCQSNVLTYDPAKTNVSTNLYYNEQEGFVEFNVPYYNRNRITIVGDVTANRLISPLKRRVAIDTIYTSTWNVNMYSNIGEDFSFGMWLGAPTLNSTPRS